MIYHNECFLKPILDFLNIVTPSLDETISILNKPDSRYVRGPRMSPANPTAPLFYLQQPYNFLLFNRNSKKFTFLITRTYFFALRNLIIRDEESTLHIKIHLKNQIKIDLNSNKLSDALNTDKGVNSLFLIKYSMASLLGNLIDY